jgi:WD40 repeat protein
MLPVKKGELVLCGEKDKIQFFELNSRKLKEIININRDIRWAPSKLLCMMNERCLCVGGANKITLIDIYNKNIIREIEESGTHRCLYKLNDNILLTGKDNDITQWKINDNNLTLVCKKEKAHQNYIREIIRFDNLIISCSDDNSIKVW